MNDNTIIIDELELVQLPESEVLQTAQDLEKFFESIEVPKEIELDKHTHIFDTALFIKTHLAFINRNAHKPIYYPYLFRLIQLEKVLLKTNK